MALLTFSACSSTTTAHHRGVKKLPDPLDFDVPLYRQAAVLLLHWSSIDFRLQTLTIEGTLSATSTRSESQKHWENGNLTTSVSHYFEDLVRQVLCRRAAHFLCFRSGHIVPALVLEQPGVDSVFSYPCIPHSL